MFTSESVAEGHPDKMADQMADAILDVILAQDPKGRVACDILIKNDTIVVAGEITTHASFDAEAIVQSVAREIGYNDSFQVISLLSKQSPDITIGVDRGGAGDQGTVFGYACTDTDALMPAPIYYAHQMLLRRKTLGYDWIRPDGKAQVTFRYEDNKPAEVMAVVFSTQHDEHVSLDTIKECVHEEIIKPVLKPEWLTKNTRYFINPSGRFVLGGPSADAGLTGRKITVDAYGGMSRDGGGCFSGKDPSKLDRSGAYMARLIAKYIVANKLAICCEVQISYAIGIAEPVAFNIETFGTGEDQKLKKLILDKVDLCPHAIIDLLDLERPIYFKTACYGHFGRSEFPWENHNLIQI